MEFYTGHSTPRPQPPVPPPTVMPAMLVPSPRLPARDKVVDVFTPTSRDKEIQFFPPSPRDKVVPVLLPTPVGHAEPSVEHFAPTPMIPVPQLEVSHPSVLPTPVPLMNEPDIIPAFDQLAISTGVSTGVCSVASGEIPNFNSLLNVESISQTVDDFQNNNSSSDDSSESSSSDTSGEIETNVRHSNNTTAQKKIFFFGPN